MNPNPAPPAPARWRIAAATACIAGALALALFLKNRPAPPAAPPQVVAAAPAVDLDQMPAPTGDSAGEKAVAAALARARQKPQDATAWTDLGDAFSQRLRDTADPVHYEHAGAAYKRALALDAANVSALNGMALVTGGQHDFPASISWAEKSLAAEPRNADAHGILGDAALELGDYKGALAHYQEMMDLRPDLSSWSRGSHLLWMTGHTLQATQLMEKAIRAGSAFAENTAWCRAKLAMMHVHQGAYAAAAQVLEPSLIAKSRHPQVLLAAARIAIATREPGIAAGYFQLVLERGPNHDALVGLGDLHAAKGETEQAENYYRQVEELHASHLEDGAHSHLPIAAFWADHDRNLVEAMRVAEQKKLTLNVHEADTLAWVYHKNGRHAEAVEAMKRALAQKTPDAQIHYHAGLIAEAAGDLEAARRHLRTAIALDPHFSLLEGPKAAAALVRLSTGQSTASIPTAPEKQ